MSVHFSLGNVIIDCPDKPVNKSATNKETVHVQLFAKGVEQCFLEQVVSETLNCALLDTGCSANVCSINWLQCYVDILPTDTDLQETYAVVRFSNLELDIPINH